MYVSYVTTYYAERGMSYRYNHDTNTNASRRRYVETDGADRNTSLMICSSLDLPNEYREIVNYAEHPEIIISIIISAQYV
jgi:hypothetical protein